MRWFFLLFLLTATVLVSAGCGSANNPSTPGPSAPAPAPTPVFTYPYFTYFGIYGTTGANGLFEGPSGVAVGCGYLAVSDSNYYNVQVFDNLGQYLYSIPMNQPYGMDITRLSDGTVVLCIANYGSGEVDAFDLTHGAYSFDAYWTAGGNMVGPTDVKFDSQGNLVVADWGNSLLYNLSWSGDDVLAVSHGYSGTTPGGLCLDANNNVYATDSTANQVVRYDSNLKYVNAFGGAAWAVPLTYPMGIALDSENRLLIADDGNSRVIRTDTSGNFIQEIGVGNFDSPHFLALDAENDLFVADNYYAAVLEFTAQ